MLSNRNGCQQTESKRQKYQDLCGNNNKMTINDADALLYRREKGISKQILVIHQNLQIFEIS